MTKFILYKKKVIEQYEKVQKICDEVSYSSKTNPLITPILEKETNSSFSIHTNDELVNVKDLSRIWFLTQAEDEKTIINLLEKGIKSFVIDNEPDLKLFLSTIKNRNEKIRLLLRAKLKEMSIRTEKYFVFGMNSNMINKYLKKITNPNITLGVHVHRKTQNLSEWRLKQELDDLIEEWPKVKIINIGGGLPSSYANTNDNVIPTIFKKLEELRYWLNKKKVKLIIEPGRFIAAPSVELETEIKLVYENNIIINASVYNSDMDALIVPVKLRIKEELSKDEGMPFVIKGLTPCSLDLFRYRVYLKNPKKGGKLTFLNAGAYNFTTNFCNLKEIDTVQQ